MFFSEIRRVQADHATPARSPSKSVGSTSTGFIKHFHITRRYFDTFKNVSKISYERGNSWTRDAGLVRAVTAGLVTLDSYVPWYVLLLQGVS